MIPLIIGIAVLQIYRFKKNKISKSYFLHTFFYLLVFSLIFFRSVHNLLLLINVCFYSYFLFKVGIKLKWRKVKFEIYILIFFFIILLNTALHIPYFKGIDTFLHLLLYPVIFIGIKSEKVTISILKTIKIFITSVIVSLFYLIILNIYFKKTLFYTNTFFSEYLGVTHVYYGIFLGLTLCFLLAFKLKNITYLNKRLDNILFLFLFLALIHIGARTALLAVLLLVLISIYLKIKLIWYKKFIIIGLFLASLFFVGYHTIPRFKSGLFSIKKVYTSIKLQNKQDIIHNSWRNMYQRYLVTKYTLKEIKKHYIVGIGIKNVKTKISNKIIKDGFIYFEPINSHNQYLDFLVGLGAPFFMFFLWLLIKFFKKFSTNIFSVYYLIFFLIIMLTESILVRAKGISVFFLFYVLFSLKDNSSIKSDINV